MCSNSKIELFIIAWTIHCMYIVDTLCYNVPKLVEEGVAMNVGGKIKRYREIRGLTQLKLSQLSGVSLSSLKKYEADERSPKPAQLKKIAEVLGINPNVLIDIDASTCGAFMHYFLSLAKMGNIQFHGEKGTDGKYDIDSLTFSFDSPVLKYFLKEWADGKEVIDHLRAEAVNSPDEVAKNLLLNRADEIEQMLELHAMDSQMLVKQQKK